MDIGHLRKLKEQEIHFENDDFNSLRKSDLQDILDCFFHTQVCLYAQLKAVNEKSICERIFS